MLQIISNPKNTYIEASQQALAALVIAISAFLGRIYFLIEPGPSSYTSKLLLLAMALFAWSMGTEELHRSEADDTNPIVAVIAQRIGFIQASLGSALLLIAVL